MNNTRTNYKSKKEKNRAINFCKIKRNPHENTRNNYKSSY